MFHRSMIGACAVIACACMTSATCAETEIRLVARTGQPAPGTESGTNFWLFTNGLNHWMMHPVIDADGHVAFVARVTGPDMDLAQRNGLWIERDGALELVARSGTLAPGIDGGIQFSGFPSDYLPMPPMVSGGKLAFDAELAGGGAQFGNNIASYKELTDGTLQLIARHGAQAAGFAPGVVYGTSAFLNGFNDAGHVMLQGNVSGAGISDANNEAIWTDRDGTLAAVVKEGDAVPGFPELVFARGVLGSSPSAFPQAFFNAQSQIFFQGNLAGADIDYYNDEALWIEEAGVITKVLRESDPAPGAGGGVTFGGNSVSLSVFGATFNDDADSAFSIELGGSIPTTNALFSTHRGSLELVEIPGQEFDEGLLANPTLNDAASLAFRAALPDDDNDPFTQPPWELWSDHGGSLELVATTGDAIANMPGYTLESVGILHGFNDAGQAAFAGSLNGPNGEFLYHVLMLTDVDGGIQKVAAVGELFDVMGDGSEMLEIVRIVPGGLSNTGHVVFRLDFSEVDSAHYVASANEIVATCAGDMVGSAQFAPPGDGAVDAADLAFLLGEWGRNPGSAADFVSSATFQSPPDGFVDAADLAFLLGEWGLCE